jgi:putative chitinase
MTDIDWELAQSRLGVMEDGIPGVETFGMLISKIAKNSTDVALFFAEASDRYQLTTVERLCEFIAQTVVETGGYRLWSENLDYTAEQIFAVWPTRFPTLATAEPYAHNPQALANRVYNNRMGNTGVNDGWLYRGRGAIQITGRGNYRLYGNRLGLDLIGSPDAVAKPNLGLHVAGEFWTVNCVNCAIDAGNFTQARRIVNGGITGLMSVQQRRQRLMEFFI